MPMVWKGLSVPPSGRTSSVAPDARAAGMGDMGVATSVDAFSQQWNISKYAF